MAAPRFWSSFAEALQISAQTRGFIAFVPWWLVICILVPVTAAWLVGGPNISKLETSGVVTVLSAFAVIRAL